jgi:hypothetical protein
MFTRARFPRLPLENVTCSHSGHVSGGQLRPEARVAVFTDTVLRTTTKRGGLGGGHPERRAREPII